MVAMERTIRRIRRFVSDWCRWLAAGAAAVLLGSAARGRGVLDVYVAGHCWTCEETHRLAALAAARFPGLEVRLRDVDATAPLPDRVVAVPTYLLDGTVISLGNPAPEALLTRIRSSLLTAPVCKPDYRRAAHAGGQWPR
jgi:hypothetical protein